MSSKLKDAANALKLLCEQNDLPLEETDGSGAEDFILETLSDIQAGDYDFNEREGTLRLGICCGSVLEISSVTLEEIEKFVIKEVI
jgi:hypothetical protein